MVKNKLRITIVLNVRSKYLGDMFVWTNKCVVLNGDFVIKEKRSVHLLARYTCYRVANNSTCSYVYKRIVWHA